MGTLGTETRELLFKITGLSEKTVLKVIFKAFFPHINCQIRPQVHVKQSVSVVIADGHTSPIQRFMWVCSILALPNPFSWEMK